jgi:hypothetical protein
MAVQWHLTFSNVAECERWNVSIRVDDTVEEVGGQSHGKLYCVSANLSTDSLGQLKEVSTTVGTATGLWTARGIGRIGDNGNRSIAMRAFTKGSGGVDDDSVTAAEGGVEVVAGTGGGGVGGDAVTAAGEGVDVAGTGGGGVAGNPVTAGAGGVEVAATGGGKRRRFDGR